MYVDPSGHDWWNPTTWDWASIGMIALSTAEVIGGVVLIATGVGATAGMALIGAGTGSIIGGVINQQNGGTFFGGWAGGQISGLISGFVPFGGALAGFASSITTDIIDKGFSGIDFGKAGLCVFAGALLDVVPGSINYAMGQKIINPEMALRLVLSFEGTLISISNGIINSGLGKVRDAKKQKLLY